MRLGSFSKTTVDNIRFQIDYADWLEDPELIDTFELGSDPSGLVVSGAAINGGTSLTFFVGGGADGEAHNLLITITTDEGQTRMDYIAVTVSDP